MIFSPVSATLKNGVQIIREPCGGRLTPLLLKSVDKMAHFISLGISIPAGLESSGH